MRRLSALVALIIVSTPGPAATLSGAGRPGSPVPDPGTGPARAAQTGRRARDAASGRDRSQRHRVATGSRLGFERRQRPDAAIS